MQMTRADVTVSASELTGSMCTPGTRVSLLGDLLSWAAASESPCVFWLNGLAGTGKSTIARTLCERLNEQRLLGASFFISRDQPDRREASNIVRSIAHQLAIRWRPVSDALCTKLRETPISAARSLQEQITDLILIPARELPGDASCIIVIDALDESLTDFLGRPGGDLLLLLGRQISQLAGRIRLFITSRNEMPIQQMFQELSTTSQTVVKLHDLDHTIVQADITTYLTHSFTVIRKTRLDLVLAEWPSTQAVGELVQLSGLLFIYAATAVRFVNARKHSPRDRLAQMLGQQRTHTRASPYAQLDELYRRILSDAVRDSGDDEEFLCQRLQAVMAVIVLAQTPLNLEALSIFSGVGPDGTGIVVGSLLSLLADSNSGVRVFHPSFSDFAIDTARCTDPRLCVTPTVDHGAIAFRCLILMNRHLRYDICSIRDPTIANKDVQYLDAALHENVSVALRYAASFWCIHLAASGAPDSLLLDALDEFCQKHLFHWLEVLSLVEYVAPAETTLLKAIEWCDVRRLVDWRARQGGSDALSWQKHTLNTITCARNLLWDVTRALQIFAIPIRSHALHAYHSAFVTMPLCVLLETLANECLPSRLPRLVSPRAANWGPSPRVVEGHSGTVWCATYSPDGTRIVSGSADCTVRVWNAVTFEQPAELKGHQDEVNSVVFSPDGTRVVSGSDDHTVRVWNAVTFEQLAELEGHKSRVRSVAFSPDGTNIISGSDDRTVRVWNAVAFEQLAELEGHQDWVRSVAFSPNGTHIISGSDDCTVRVWNAVTFEYLARLEGHQDWVRAVTFSPDGTYVVSGSNDCTVRVWDLVTFKQLVELEGHKSRVRSVSFSPDGAHIISGSDDHTVRVWNAVTFEQLAELKGHQLDVNSVAFSPDNTHIVSSSDDRTIRVWNAVTFEQLAELEGHQDWVRSVAFSPDGTYIISSSGDCTVRVWSADPFQQLAELKGHQGGVNSVAFSPDGTHIASGSDDCTVRVWNAITFEQLAELKGHLNRVRSVAFSPDGTHLVSGSDDHRLSVWNAVTFKQLATLEGHQHWVRSVSFSRDNKAILSHDWNGSQLAWIRNNSDFST
jgi:WD40 repeat protein